MGIKMGENWKLTLMNSNILWWRGIIFINIIIYVVGDIKKQKKE